MPPAIPRRMGVCFPCIFKSPVPSGAFTTVRWDPPPRGTRLCAEVWYLLCSCNAKVGQWCWHGMQAPNGAWVTPAFALSRSKLDELRPFPASAALPLAPDSAPAPPSQPPHPLATASQQATASRGAAAQPAQDLHCGGSAAEDPSARGGAEAAGGPCKAAWFTHVVFDCDGVLVDSERASCEALRRAVLEVTGVIDSRAAPFRTFSLILCVAARLPWDLAVYCCLSAGVVYVSTRVLLRTCCSHSC